MLTKKIKYEDFNGNEVEKEFYFNLSKAEMLEYDASLPGGALEYLTFLMNNKMNGPILAAFRDLIARSYGERLPDGRFIKSEERRDAFLASDAYSELFMEIISSEESAAAFVNGVVPQVKEKQKVASDNIVPIG